MVTPFLLLMVLLRSLVLPLKAVLMNLLSLSASFGALVFIFQQGHLSGLLDFSPAPLDPTIPVLVFCVVFGLSMDYEVFLLTRMREEWRAHGDNRRAVAAGLQASGRLVTGAAAIMVTVFLVFGLVSSVVVIKALGLGMAIAIFVDASLVRALVVPALMRLLGPVNWWAPRWLQNSRPPAEKTTPA
jgi:RND superfamily putative drug exporter